MLRRTYDEFVSCIGSCDDLRVVSYTGPELILALGFRANSALIIGIGDAAQWTSKPKDAEELYPRSQALPDASAFPPRQHDTANILSQHPLLTSVSLSAQAMAINYDPCLASLCRA